MRQLPPIKNFLRTPEERFQNLPDFSFVPHYTEIGGLRVAYIDEGPKEGPVVLLMHGEPAWSFLYRKMIPILVAAGMRVLVPDQVGFGRTDKPTQRSDYTYENHVQWMSAWLESVDAQNITLFCQDWGSLIGLRMAAEMPDIVIAHVETPVTGTLLGAKGIGEQALIPTAPAILNAIHHATGARITRTPATPDRVRAAIRALEKVVSGHSSSR